MSEKDQSNQEQPEQPERLKGFFKFPTLPQVVDGREEIAHRLSNLLGITTEETLAVFMSDFANETELLAHIKKIFPEMPEERQQQVVKTLFTRIQENKEQEKYQAKHPKAFIDAAPSGNYQAGALDAALMINPSGKSETDKRLINIMKLGVPVYSFVAGSSPAMADILQFLSTYQKQLFGREKYAALAAGVAIIPIEATNYGSRIAKNPPLTGELFMAEVLTVKRLDFQPPILKFYDDINYVQMIWDDSSMAMIKLIAKQQQIHANLQEIIKTHNLANPAQYGTMAAK